MTDKTITPDEWLYIANEVEPRPEGNEWVIVKERVVKKKHANGNCIVLDGFQYEPNSLNQHCARSLSQQIKIADYLAEKGVVVYRRNGLFYAKRHWISGECLSVNEEINDCRALAVLALRKDGEGGRA